MRKHWMAAILMAMLLGACATFKVMHDESKRDRGVKIPHAKHTDQGCTDCHANNDKNEPGMPNHDICSACHDFDMAKADDRCKLCHARPDSKTDPYVKQLSPEVIFNHPAHVDKQVECAKCHTNLDKNVLPKTNRMKWCMDCHEKTKASLIECKVCHTELSRETRPKTHNGVRIPHDNPQMWETLHGQESLKDAEFCLMCHDRETSCEDCHRKNPPKSHTVAWRGRSHGMRASWDRAKCAACHEEDACIKCHRNTQPSSHQGGWGGPLNRHCVNCHYPESDTGCAVCHEQAEHPQALPSPHNLGFYGNCALCHPGGMPYRAPHIMNTSIKCLGCH